MILELLRGADLQSTSRKYRGTAATLSDWRDRFLAAGDAGIKSREVEVEDEEKRRPKSVVASPSVETELRREKDRADGGRLPFGFVEVESMSQTVSASSSKMYGVARVVSVWNLARSSFYSARSRERDPRAPRKRGPKVLPDAELLAAIGKLFNEAAFTGEGYRKIWARLRCQGIRTSKERVLRLLREH